MTFNDNRNTLTLLLTRRSAKARNLSSPGPDQDQLRDILKAGLRVPDHGKLAPWRFIVIEGEGQKRLSHIFATAYRSEKPGASNLELEGIRNFPQQAPVMIAVLSKLNTERAIPEWEQRLSAGAACQNIILAAHALGFKANWLTGWAAYSAEIIKELGGEENDKIAGFLFIGSSEKELSERPRPDFDDIVSDYPLR